MKAGCPVWQTVSCTLKAKVVVLHGHWKRANKKTRLDKQVSYRDVFLQLLHVETGNVLTDVRSTVRIKHVKPKGGQCCQTLKDTISHFVQTTTNHCVSFGCEAASGFNHSKCSSGGPESSIACCLLNISSLLTVCMKAFNLLLYWTLSARPQK